MGYDATNYLPLSISKKKLISFIKLLGYEGKGNYYYYYKDDDYKYLYGVLLTLSYDEKSILIFTRTPIYCSYYDLEFQNYTIKQIRDFFGGYFVSDYGKNRYFPNGKDNYPPAQRGCFAAQFSLSNRFADLNIMLQNYNPNKQQEDVLDVFGVNSSALLSNMATTYITSIIENYFRQLYMAMLRYSEKKEKIISSVKINNYDLYKASQGEITIEEMVALSKTFQNIHKIDHYFRELDPKIDIKGTLSKPYHNRKENLFQTLDRILEQRHSMVHRLNIDKSYRQNELKQDIKSVKKALDRVYEHICEIYNW